MRLPLVLLLIVITTAGSAQVGQEQRVEISIDELADEFVVAPVGEYGLVVFGETDAATKDGENKWRFIQYNTDFDKVGARSVYIEKRYESKGHFFQDSMLYVLFTAINRGDEYQLVRINVESFKTRTVTGAMPKSVQLRDFKIHKEYLYAAGTTGKGDVICFANLRNRILKTIPLAYKGTNTIQSIDITREDVVAFTVTNFRRNDGVVYIQSFDEGHLIDEVHVDPQSDNNLLSARISTIDDNTRIVAGTYARMRQNGTGMFLAKISDGQQQFITYHNFSDFENFFTYLSTRAQVKMSRKIERKEKKGKDLNLNYQLLTHDMIQRGDQYLMIAEAYYKTYRTVQRWESVYYAGRYRRMLVPRQVFDGYQYSHGVVAAFDANGRLLWDNTFEMNDFKSFELKERIQVNPRDDVIEMAYGVEGRIRTKVIAGNAVVDRKGAAAITTGKRGDKVRKSTLTNLEYWYDEFFVVWGYQKIKESKDRNRDGSRKRKVFYFNKMRVH